MKVLLVIFICIASIPTSAQTDARIGARAGLLDLKIGGQETEYRGATANVSIRHRSPMFYSKLELGHGEDASGRISYGSVTQGIIFRPGKNTEIIPVVGYELIGAAAGQFEMDSSGVFTGLILGHNVGKARITLSHLHLSNLETSVVINNVKGFAKGDASETRVGLLFPPCRNWSVSLDVSKKDIDITKRINAKFLFVEATAVYRF